MSAACRERQILVVEDEPAIQRGLCDVLAFHGHRPRPVDDGETGLREALQGAYDLVLLDVMLPGLDGFSVCRSLRRERPELPILMLTARDAEADILEGFRCGSDDYVTKPFSVAELVARIEALLRRSASSAPAVPEERFAFGGWCVEPAAGRAVRNGGPHREAGQEEVTLSPREVLLLDLFAREAGRIVSRRRLLREIWGMEGAERVETRTVDVHIGKLRKKIGGGAASPIETVRGEGYRYLGPAK